MDALQRENEALREAVERLEVEKLALLNEANKEIEKRERVERRLAVVELELRDIKINWAKKRESYAREH